MIWDMKRPAKVSAEQSGAHQAVLRPPSKEFIAAKPNEKDQMDLDKLDRDNGNPRLTDLSLGPEIFMIQE